MSKLEQTYPRCVFLILPFLVIVIAHEEQSVLLKLKQQWRNPPSLDSWKITSSSSSSSAHYVDWEGVYCDENYSVTSISLSHKNITEKIPSFLCDLNNLTEIDFSLNNFHGNFPIFIYNCTGLKILDLSQNWLFGQIPPDIDRFLVLEELNLGGNNFTGDIPKSIGKISGLKTLLLHQNLLDGIIPAEIGNLSNLEFLGLGLNPFPEWKIPSEFGKLKKLKEFWAADVKLIGEIPETVGDLIDLETLDLSTNQLEGEIPVGIGKLPLLKQIRLFRNQLTGSLPEDLGLFAKLEALEVAENELTGNLPENLCAGGELIRISVYTNNLSGGVSEVLEKCNSLNVFELYGNRFSGEFPSGIWSLKNLSIVMISDNLFTGSLPDEFAASLIRVEITNNMFSGKIPGKLTRLSNLLTLSLDGNQLSGPIPSQIISWRSLTFLNLARNQLSGKIPAAIGQLPNLTELDLSENRLSGEIPCQISQLNLISLNLSANHLNGRIPPEMDNLSFENSFMNNSGLCGRNLESVPSCILKQNSVRSFAKVFIVVLIATAVICLGIVSFVLFAFRDYRRKPSERDISSWKLTSFHRLQFTESDILSSLTENNMIGSGGSGKVYRVDISGLDESVAVKKIVNKGKLDKQLEKEFQTEIRILGTIRHMNIVKLLCCADCYNSMLLVYEYMKNQSLDQWLHAKKRTFSGSGSAHRAALDWPTRLQIAIGAAQGLCYMHDSCSPPIIHRDVKSSNILLDHEFRAKIADFGLAKLLSKHGAPQTMSSMAGSFGYLAPEYGCTTKVNEKVDVYSFGVVLLELATGREANKADERTSLVVWARCLFDEGKSIIDAFDKEIKEPCHLDEISSVFKLGLACTGTSPSTRPTMKEVLEILLQCGPQQGSSGAQNTMKTKEEDVNPLIVAESNRTREADSQRGIQMTGCADSLVCSNV